VAIEYNKKKDRVVYGGGPRDLQRKQQQLQAVSNPEFYESIITDLKDQLKDVTAELMKRGPYDPSKKFTAEEFDAELNKQAAELIINADKLKVENKTLAEDLGQAIEKIKELEIKLESKDEVITALKSRSVGEGEVFIEDTDRPEMETVFIDPTEVGQNKMKSHINVKDTDSKEDVNSKVNKLKGLIGSVKK